MLDVHSMRPGGAVQRKIPYSAVPHALVADDRLSPTDVRVAAALLYWARGQDHCWPADASIGRRIGRSVGTVQRCLRRLEDAGWVARERADVPNGRRILLRWRAAAPGAGAQPAAAPARSEGDVGVKGDAPKEPPRSARERPRPDGPPPGPPLRATAPAPAPPTPAPAPPPPEPPRRPWAVAADLAAWARSDDPVLRAEAARRLAPRPGPPPPPATLAELLGRLGESPAYPAQAAEALAIALDDRKSWRGFHARCREAFEGSRRAADLVRALEIAAKPHARNRGAMFMAALQSADSPGNSRRGGLGPPPAAGG